MTTITASEIQGGLWQIVNGSPNETGSLTESQIAALRLLMEIGGCEEFLGNVSAEEIDKLLRRLRDVAHSPLGTETRARLRKTSSGHLNRTSHYAAPGGKNS